MPLIPLDWIVEGRNARRMPVSRAAEEGLRRSIEAQGVLQPVLLRPTPGEDPRPDPDWKHGLQLVLGSRRVRAARAAGLIEIPADVRHMTDVEVQEAQMAENVQREAMHPVDQWRAIRELIQDHALSFEQAAGALGLDDRLMRRMEHLGRLNETLLKFCEIDMPSAHHLRLIAAAPAKLQAKVAGQKGLLEERNGRQTVMWHDIANRCAVERIPRSVAIFDPSAISIVWDEDLFAEPGAKDQYTTSDVDTFIKCQKDALHKQVAALAKQKKRHQVALARDRYAITFPAGFKEVHGAKPERLKAHETAFHAVAPDGSILVKVAIDTKAAAAAAKKPAPAKRQAPLADKAAGAADPDDGEDDDAGDGGTAVRPPFTKVGQALIAAAKGDAVRTALEEPRATQCVLNLLVLALAADNVTIYANRARVRFDDLIARMLAPGGNFLDVSTADSVSIAQTAIGRILNFVGPAAMNFNPDSGDAGEWIGTAIGAAHALPRFDTEAFLQTASLAELKRAATGAGLLATGTAANLRERLIGRAPNYRPEAADFGAPAPRERAHV
jgi:ParB family transcriptional regulator, chromosome partitioning protein